MDRLDALFALFDRHGDAHYGEGVTQRAHALQTAAAARAAGEGEAMIAAALLHDIGQMIDGAGDAAARERRDARHEIGGADYLSGLFGDAVIAPIRLHVAAKRYLCAVEPAYRDTLSPASQLSLELQGGAMTTAEAAAFAATPFADAAVRLRRYDDGGKALGVVLPSLDEYRPLLARVSRN